MADEITVTTPQAPQPVGDLVAPIVQTSEKVAHIEEQNAQNNERLLREISDLEARLQTATGERFNALSSRLELLETKLEQQAAAIPAQTADTIEQLPDAVEMTTPEIDASPAPPEKERRGIRARRRKKRTTK